MTSEETKAVAAVANTVGKVVDLMAGVGRYVAEVVDDVPHNLVGLAIGDKLRARRKDNAEKLASEAKIYIEKINPARLSEPSPSVLLPLISACIDEERSELRGLWAKLLANSAIDGGTRVRREFFETVKKLEPIDVAVLETFDEVGVLRPNSTPEQINCMYRSLVARNVSTGLNNLYLLVSLKALDELRCVGRANNTSLWCLSNYGQALKTACKVE